MTEKTYQIRLGKKYARKSAALIEAALEAQKNNEIETKDTESPDFNGELPEDSKKIVAKKLSD